MLYSVPSMLLIEVDKRNQALYTKAIQGPWFLGKPCQNLFYEPICVISDSSNTQKTSKTKAS